MYTQDELAKLSPAELREKMAEVAQHRKVPMVNAETQTREKIVGMRKLEEVLSKYVVWDSGECSVIGLLLPAACCCCCGCCFVLCRARPSAVSTQPDFGGGSDVGFPSKLTRICPAAGTAAKDKVRKRSKTNSGPDQIAKSSKSTTKAQHMAMDKREKADRNLQVNFHNRALTNKTAIEKAKPQKPRDVKDRVCKLIHAKVMLDKKHDEASIKRTAMPDFVQEQFLNQFGLESIATKHTHGFAAGIWANETVENGDHLVRIFGRLAGILEPEKYSSMQVNFVMDMLDCLFVSSRAAHRLQEALMKNQPVDRALVHEKCAQLMTAYREDWHKDLISDLDEHVLDGDGHAKTVCTIKGHNVDESELGLVPTLSLLDVVLRHWDKHEEQRHAALRELFDQFDTNGDHVLQLHEWEQLIESCDKQKWIADGNKEEDFEWDRPAKVVNKMFKIALHESRLEDTDAIALPAFITVAHVYRVIDPTTPWDRKSIIQMHGAAVEQAILTAAQGTLAMNQIHSAKDTTGDGKADWVEIDVDGDGTVDVIGIDTNGDSVLDSFDVGTDVDGDGVVDVAPEGSGAVQFGDHNKPSKVDENVAEPQRRRESEGIAPSV